MDVIKIVNIITQGTNLFKMITGLVDDVKDTLSKEDIIQIEDALQALQKENDATYNRIKAKLDAASGR